MTTYLVASEKNCAKERAVIEFFGKENFKTLPADAHEGNLFNGQVFERLEKRLSSFHPDRKEIYLAIEGGYFKRDNRFFMGDVCAIKDEYGVRVGIGYLFELSESMYKFVKCGGQLGELVTKITKADKNPARIRQRGVVSYITNGKVSRSDGIIKAVENAFYASYDCLPKNVKIVKKNELSKYYQKLDERCKKELRELG